MREEPWPLGDGRGSSWTTHMPGATGRYSHDPSTAHNHPREDIFISSSERRKLNFCEAQQLAQGPSQ